MSAFARSRALRCAPLVLGLLAGAPASVRAADLSVLPIPTFPGLPADDLHRMTAAAARLYEGSSIGTIERWRSPDTRNAGEVKLVNSFESHGMPCRTIDYTIRFNDNRDRPNRYVMTWCKVGSDWKIVELPVPRDGGAASGGSKS
ncbi:hypothetical protein [Rhodopila sp.]|jgi:hypothetical protein|uniref:hypothetical protein n=1 Tax=Rhodopila sp. TaxID=2480087 RepID=UPI002B7F7173|nr:hypothetical protein [Rhodopila sp.]HVZ07625.1 hypothetical protein [Rhodopila sp.]